MLSVPRIRSGCSLRSARADCVTKCLVNDGAPCPDASRSGRHASTDWLCRRQCEPMLCTGPAQSGPALAPRSWQVFLQRLDAPVPPRQWRCGPRAALCGARQLPVQRGELVAQVCRDRKVPVVPRQLPRGVLGGAAHRLGVLVLQRFHGGLPGEDVRTSSSPACSG